MERLHKARYRQVSWQGVRQQSQPPTTSKKCGWCRVAKKRAVHAQRLQRRYRVIACWNGAGQLRVIIKGAASAAAEDKRFVLSGLRCIASKRYAKKRTDNAGQLGLQARKPARYRQAGCCSNSCAHASPVRGYATQRWRDATRYSQSCYCRGVGAAHSKERAVVRANPSSRTDPTRVIGPQCSVHGIIKGEHVFAHPRIVASVADKTRCGGW